MTTYELIEQSVLDAMGILEPEEQVAFEAALANAGPEVRAMVRHEQERLLDLHDLLPPDAPRPELRDMVISAVRAAMRASDAPAVGRVLPGASHRRAAAPTFRPARRVSPMWRASAIALGAVVVGLTAVTLDIHRVYQVAGSRGVVDRLYDGMGAEVLQAFVYDPENTQLVSRMTPVSQQGSRAEAALWHHPDWSSAKLFVRQLKTAPNERLRLVVLDDNDRIVSEVAAFQGTGELAQFEVHIDVQSKPRLAICRTVDGADELLLRALPSEL